MFREWTQRVGSAVPRGFSRYYILQQLKEQPHTGKEIIDSAIEASAGNWKPSPGLIYPLLGRLLDEGLIEESENGKYQITDHGKTILTDLDFAICAQDTDILPSTAYSKFLAIMSYSWTFLPLFKYGTVANVWRVPPPPIDP